MRVTWDASIGDISGYKLQMIPMITGGKRQELYLRPTQTSAVVRDLSPDTEYQISLFALKGLTPSEPIVVMQKMQPVKVSLGEDEIVIFKTDFDKAQGESQFLLLFLRQSIQYSKMHSITLTEHILQLHSHLP